MMTAAPPNRNVRGFNSDLHQRLVNNIAQYRAHHQQVNEQKAYADALMNGRSDSMSEGKDVVGNKPCEVQEPQGGHAAQFLAPGVHETSDASSFSHTLNETELRNLLLEKYMAKHAHGVMEDTHVDQPPQKKNQSPDQHVSLFVLHPTEAKNEYDHLSHGSGAVHDRFVPSVGTSLSRVNDRNTSAMSFLNRQASPASRNADDSVLLDRLKSIRSRLNNFMRSVHTSNTQPPQENKVQSVSDEEPNTMKGSLVELQELVADAKQVSNEFRLASLILSKKLADSLSATNCTSPTPSKSCDWKEHFYQSLGTSSSSPHPDETSLRMLQKVAVEKSLPDPADARLFHIVSHCLSDSETSLSLAIQLEELLELIQLLDSHEGVNPLVILTLNLETVLKSFEKQGDAYRAISNLSDFHGFFSRLEYYWMMSEKDEWTIQQLDDMVLDVLEALLLSVKEDTFGHHLGEFKQRLVDLRTRLIHLNITLTPNLNTFPPGLVSEKIRNQHFFLTLHPSVLKRESLLQKPSEEPRVMTSREGETSPPRSLQFIHRLYGHSNTTQDFLQRFNQDITSRLNRLFVKLYGRINQLNTFVESRHGQARLFHNRSHLSPARVQLLSSVSQDIQKHLTHLNRLRSHALSHIDRRLDSLHTHRIESYHFPIFFYEFFSRKKPKVTEHNHRSRLLHPNVQGSSPDFSGCRDGSCSNSVSTMEDSTLDTLQGFLGDTLAWKDKRLVRHFSHVSKNADHSLQHYASFLMSLKKECTDKTTDKKYKDATTLYSKLTACENMQNSFSKITQAVEKLRDLLDLASRFLEAESPSTIFYLNDQVNKLTECSASG